MAKEVLKRALLGGNGSESRNLNDPDTLAMKIATSYSEKIVTSWISSKFMVLVLEAKHESFSRESYAIHDTSESLHTHKKSCRY